MAGCAPVVVRAACWRATVVVVLALCAVLAGCGAPTPGDDVLHRGNETEPDSLDPHRARSVAAMNVLRDLGEGLVTLAPDGSLKPGLAERWDVGEDGLVWTFELRDGLRWSDGEPLDAHDLVYSFRRLVDPATASFNADMLSALERAPEIIAGDAPPTSLGAEAVDDATLELRLSRAVPWFAELLTHPSTYPVQAAVIDAHGDRWARAGRHVSAGAYVLAEWVQGSHVTLRANPHYHRADGVAIAEVRHYATVDRQGEYNRYRAGDLQVTANVPSSGFDRIRERHGDELKLAPYLGLYFFGYNLVREPLADDARLRRALSFAIDRERIAKDVVGRGELPAWRLVPPALEDYAPPELAAESWSRDRREEEARRLYEAAGYGEGRVPDIELLYNDSGDNRRIALAVQAMWEDVLGFRAPLRGEEFQVMLQTIRTGADTSVFRLSWIADYQDPHSFLTMFESGHSSNLTGYASDAFDALMADARLARTERQRLSRLADAEALLLEDQPIIPVYWWVSKRLVAPEVHGWRDHPLDIHLSRHLSLRPVSP